MNKAEFVNAMAEQTGLSKKDSEAAINAFVNIVSDELVKKEKVSLIGFIMGLVISLATTFIIIYG